MIVKLLRGQPSLTVSVVEPGCNGRKLSHIDGIRLVIRAPECPCLLKSEIVRTGCWPGNEPNSEKENCRPDQLPAIVYNAWDTDDNGDIEFRFDGLLDRLPPGRYIGQVTYENGVSLVTLDLDLWPTRFIPESATASFGNHVRKCP